MLGVMPDWWMDFMLWLDTATVPLYVVFGFIIALSLADLIVSLVQHLRSTYRRD